jgi:radical SAM superfamily enzyme YgiQ (UPF0313 family)
MDLLLIEVEQKRSVSEANTTIPPLGLAYIAAVAEQEGFKVDIIDLNIENGDIERKIEKAGLVGISCYTNNYPEALRVLRLAQKYGRKTVLGGPHATALPYEVLNDGFDFVVLGEGELVILELLRALDRGVKPSARGLAYMEKGIIRKNGVKRVEELDSLPLPARHLLDLEKYTYPGAIATSRGCIYSCRYCSARTISGKLRLRNAKKVIDEIAYLRDLGLDSFFVIDPNFAFDKKRVLKICKGVKDLHMEWIAELRLDHVNAEIIRAMAKAGCKVGRFGIESGSQRVVDLINKGIKIGDVLKIVKIFLGEGIMPVCGFMIGHPTETREEFEATLKLALKIKELGGEVTFAVQTPYPGSYLYRRAESLGIKILTRDWSEYHHLNPIVETENFSNEDLRRMLFDSITSIMGITIPNVLLSEERPEVIRVGNGLERKSFRSIAPHFI